MFFLKILDKKLFIKSHIIVIILFTFLYWIASYLYSNYKNIRRIDNIFNNHTLSEKNYKKWQLFDCFYFSLITQTTVGYGIIYPKTFLMKLISIIQLLSIYIVYIIAY